jgi:predicted nucleic acid-binding Zn ribbon protein
MTEGLGAILRDPTRCYATGCTNENEILLHMSEDPWTGSDLCWEHAAIAVRASEIVLTCDCFFCVRARRRLLDMPG